MANMIAKRAFRYGARSLRPGDSFEASDAVARFYVTVGRAARVGAPMAPPPEAEIDDDPLREVAGAPLGATRRGKKRGRYKRRDMRAED